MSDASQFGEYNKWTGRKDAALRRPKLDCGCPNIGEVFFHLWCDRLACEQHAEDPHDCGEYAGVKSGAEEVSDPGEAAADYGAAMERRFAAAGCTLPVMCRGCRRVPLPLPEAKLCGPCAALPSCAAERSNERTGRRMVCFRPAGHEPPTHEDLVSGSQWVGEENQVEALRPFFRPALDAEAEALAARVHAAAVLALTDQPEPGVHPVDASSDPAPDAPRKSIFTDLYAALRARARRGGTPS